MPKPKPFATEVELCKRFLSGIPKEWTAFAETAGWDILLVRNSDGFQIGIQAKLRLNIEVVNQAIEDGRSYSATRPGPDCRAILVPDCDAGSFSTICGYIGITIIRVYDPGRDHRSYGNGLKFYPYLPSEKQPYDSGDWFECCPVKRHTLPEYVPDVAAGASSPTQLTDWKIRAIKIAVTLEKRGFVTRHDFKAHNIDYRRWIAADGWLKAVNGRYIAHRMPDFKRQHPVVYEQIAADAEKWMPAAAVLTGQIGRLL